MFSMIIAPIANIIITIIISSSTISNGNRTEWSTTQGVTGRVIWNYEHDYPWIAQHDVLLPINCVNNKMRETFLASGWRKAFKV